VDGCGNGGIVDTGEAVVRRPESGEEHHKGRGLVCLTEGLGLLVKLVIEGEAVDLRLAKGDGRPGLSQSSSAGWLPSSCSSQYAS
jgi:hypothetical protein